MAHAEFTTAAVVKTSAAPVKKSSDLFSTSAATVLPLGQKKEEV